jgi:hypothetical protein
LLRDTTARERDGMRETQFAAFRGGKHQATPPAKVSKVKSLKTGELLTLGSLGGSDHFPMLNARGHLVHCETPGRFRVELAQVGSVNIQQLTFDDFGL